VSASVAAATADRLRAEGALMPRFDTESPEPSRWRSPISRHSAVNGAHYLIYVVHDLSSIAVIILLVSSTIREAAAPLGGALLASLISGWLLVGYRARERSARGHLTRTEVVSSCIVNQGLAVMLLGYWLLGPALEPGQTRVFACAVAAHAAYCIVRCARLYFSVTTEASSDRFAETTMQLAYMVVVPNVVLFSCFALDVLPRDAATTRLWLLFECMPGALFSIAHDRTWLFAPAGLPPWRRHAICLTAYAVPAVAYAVG
jgi:hypothetical protein